jgi:quinol monooxygenase YgiN
MSASNRVPVAAAVITHEVASWDTWKAHFDAHEGARKAAGIIGHHLNRGLDNPNVITMYLAVGDVARAKAFFGSADLRRIMAEAGVTGAPSVAWITPVSEHIVWDRELPAMLVTHPVADFDKWLAGYQAADAVQKQGGIIGHAVNRSVDDPNTVIVYHQAETHDALRAFMANPGLQEAMKKAGVTGVPQVSYHTGGWGKFY